VNSDKDGEIFVFLKQMQEAFDQTEGLALESAASSAMQEALKQNFGAMRDEVEQVLGYFLEVPAQAKLANQALDISATTKMIEAQFASLTGDAIDALGEITLQDVISKVLDLAITGLQKILEFLTELLPKQVLRDLLILIPQIKEALPPSDDPIDGLKDDVDELEAKIERFLHQVLGTPLVKDETQTGAGKIPPVTGPVAEPTLPGSVLWYSWDIERKLEHVWKLLTGQSFPRPDPEAIVSDPFVNPVDRGAPIATTVHKLTERIDCLTKLLGLTLYNAEWDCDGTVAPVVNPPEGELHPVGSDGHRGKRTVPPKSIKDEMHDIEDMLRKIIEILETPPSTPTPPETPPPVPVPVPECPEHSHELPSDLKRIFVYEAEVFTAAAAGDERVVDVRTAAFDLTGWIDLTELGDGDLVQIQMFVHLPGGVKRLYREATYSGLPDAGLKHLSEVVGPGYIASDHIEVVITQRASGAGFAPGLSIPYQFVVESQARAVV